MDPWTYSFGSVACSLFTVHAGFRLSFLFDDYFRKVFFSFLTNVPKAFYSLYVVITVFVTQMEEFLLVIVVRLQIKPRRRIQTREIRVRLRFICKGGLVTAGGWGVMVSGMGRQEWHNDSEHRRKNIPEREEMSWWRAGVQVELGSRTTPRPQT